LLSEDVKLKECFEEFVKLKKETNDQLLKIMISFAPVNILSSYGIANAEDTLRKYRELLNKKSVAVDKMNAESLNLVNAKLSKAGLDKNAQRIELNKYNNHMEKALAFEKKSNALDDEEVNAFQALINFEKKYRSSITLEDKKYNFHTRESSQQFDAVMDNIASIKSQRRELEKEVIAQRGNSQYS
jgi:hypothetical protein